MVPRGGLEPLRPCGLRILSPLYRILHKAARFRTSAHNPHRVNHMEMRVSLHNPALNRIDFGNQHAPEHAPCPVALEHGRREPPIISGISAPAWRLSRNAWQFGQRVAAPVARRSLSGHPIALFLARFTLKLAHPKTGAASHDITHNARRFSHNNAVGPLYLV
jgi:hypothetical protein